MFYPLAQLPFIPYVHSGKDVIFLFYIFLRVSGIFILSPLFGNKNISAQVRILLAVFLSVLISMILYDDYRGLSPKYVLNEIQSDTNFSLIELAFTSVKEFFIGYLIGFLLSIILESLLFAAQSTSIMMGFSMSRMIDPISGTTQTIIGQLYMILATLIILSLDIHHTLIRIAIESFSLAPIGNYSLSEEPLYYVISGSNRMLQYALQYASIPYAIIFLVTIGLGFMAKIMPEMNIFMVGFPLKIFVGYYSLIIAIRFFPSLIKQAFTEYEGIVKIVLRIIHSG